MLSLLSKEAIVNAASAENIDREDLKAAVDEALSHRGGEIMPTIADLWRQEGIQQGIIQNTKKNIIEALELRFGKISGESHARQAPIKALGQ